MSYVIQARNVNDALIRGCHLLKREGKSVSPRGMATLEADGPVITEYERPWECVLHLPNVREINPFFHLFEALWILAGKQDVESIAQFNSNMAQFSDDGCIFHGAYGYRLKNHFGFNQLQNVIDTLRNDQSSRQAVAVIWDAYADSGKATKDLPCNTTLYFKVRDGSLNLTVCCRSNDIIWGCYGTNAVQFAFVQQYVAAALNIAVGKYCQVSDSFHVYVDNYQGTFQKEQWERLRAICHQPLINPYDGLNPKAIFCADQVLEGVPVLKGRLFNTLQGIEYDCALLMEDPFDDTPFKYTEPFFVHVVQPMMMLWKMYRDKRASGSVDGWTHREWFEEYKPNQHIDWIASAMRWVMLREEVRKS